MLFSRGRPEVAKLLRERGAQPALAVAVVDGDLETIRRLIKAGADVNAIARPVVDKEFFEADTVSRTALMLAAEGGNFKMVRLLLHEGADVNARSGGSPNIAYVRCSRRQSGSGKTST